MRVLMQILAAALHPKDGKAQNGFLNRVEYTDNYREINQQNKIQFSLIKSLNPAAPPLGSYSHGCF